MSPLIEALADAIHAAYARMFPNHARHNVNRRARHHRRVASPQQLGAARLTLRLGLERTAREHANRCASMLAGARRGAATVRALSQLRADVAVGIMAAKARQRVRPAAANARQRFAAAGTATRTAARELADIASDTARRLGARHRHVPGTTDEHHNLAAQILARAKAYGGQRAAGENSIFTKTRGEFAW